jgi:hypothetical protein
MIVEERQPYMEADVQFLDTTNKRSINVSGGVAFEDCPRDLLCVQEDGILIEESEIKDFA